MNDFKRGQRVVYCPKDSEGKIYKTEIGIIKKIHSDGISAWVFYNFGSEAVLTNFNDLENIYNGCEQCE